MEQKLFLGALAWYLNELNFSPFNGFDEVYGNCIYPIKTPYPKSGTLSQIWACKALSPLGCAYILWILQMVILKLLCHLKVLLLQFDRQSSFWYSYIPEPNWDWEINFEIERNKQNWFRLHLDFRTFLFGESGSRWLFLCAELCDCPHN